MRSYVVRNSVYIYDTETSVKTLANLPSISLSTNQTKYCEATISVSNIDDGCDPLATWEIVFNSQIVATNPTTSVTVTNLQPDTFYQCYATISNARGSYQVYSNISATLNRVLPIISANSSSITSDSAVLAININNTPNPGVVLTIITLTNPSGGTIRTVTSTGSFSDLFTGLNPGTSYSFYVYATNSCNDTVSQLGFFTTLAAPTPVKPTVVTSESFSCGAGSNPSIVTSGHQVTSIGSSPVTSWRIEYGLTTQLGSYLPVGTGSITSPFPFNGSILGLQVVTNYYYRACASNSAGEYCGATVCVTTNTCVRCN